PALVAFARGLVGDEEMARDITQDAFVDAWRAASQHMPPFEPFETPDDLTGIRRWLFTVTFRRAIKHRRRGRRIAWESLEARGAAIPAMLRASPPFEDALAEADVLRAALRSIEPEDAACVLLQVVHGFSTAEIAEILAIRADAVRKRLSRAKQRLRDAYLTRSQPEPRQQHEG
ncbi:MAG: RNA polymerase sigma factor, partial [Nitrososphaerota archaeon]